MSTIVIKIDAHWHDFVRANIQNGRYQSETRLFEEALGLLKTRDVERFPEKEPEIKQPTQATKWVDKANIPRPLSEIKASYELNELRGLEPDALRQVLRETDDFPTYVAAMITLRHGVKITQAADELALNAPALRNYTRGFSHPGVVTLERIKAAYPREFPRFKELMDRHQIVPRKDFDLRD